MSIMNLGLEQSAEYHEEQARKAHKLERFQAIAIVGLTVIAVGVVALLIYRAYDRNRLLDESGVETTCQLENDYTKTVRRSGSTSYSVRYRFEVAGRSYFGDSTIFEVPTARAYRVIYDAADPNNNKLAGSAGFMDGRTKSGVFSALLFVACAWIARGLGAVIRKRRRRRMPGLAR